MTQIDIYVRRLADYVEEYEFNKFANIERVKWRLYLNKGDVADIETDTTTKFTNGEAKTYKEDAFITSSFFRPLTSILELFVLFSSAYRRILLEEYQTYHICGYPDLKVEKLTYEKLLAGLQIKLKPKKSFFT